MRAVVVKKLGPPESLSIENVPTPVPDDGEVLVDFHACSINYPDLLFMAGKYQVVPDLPFSPGFDAAGVVSAVDGGVKNLKPGDRVMVRLPRGGGYAEQAVSPEHLCYPMPDDMSFVDAAAMGMVYQTAYFGLLDRGQYKEGETVMVNGASGGVGIASVQFAKALGATVLAAVSKPERGEVVRAAGADHVINPTADGARKQVMALTGGGAAAVVDFVGSGPSAQFGMSCLAANASMVVVGLFGGSFDISVAMLPLKNIALRGSITGSLQEMAELMDLVKAGKVKPLPVTPRPLDQAQASLDDLRQGNVVGRVVLVP